MALKFLRAVQALEYSEQSFRVLHIEAGAVVADKIDVFGILPVAANLYQRVVSLAAKLHGIGQQIDEHLPDQWRIAKAIGQFADVDTPTPIRRLSRQLVDNLANQTVRFQRADGKRLQAAAGKTK